DLRAVHHDAPDLARAEAMFRRQLAQRIQRRVVAADAGVELERHAHRLPRRAESLGELGEAEAIRRARESGAEAAVLGLEDILDAGEALLGEERAVEAALRRAAGVHALHHRAVLGGHESRRLGARDAERMD